MLFLHVGLPRTGTTSLQTVLASKPELLAHDGYVYPEQWRDSDDLAHHPLGTAVLAGKDGLSIRDDFLRYLSANGDRRILVSTESLSNGFHEYRFPALYDFVARCSAEDSVTVLVTLRRIDVMIASLFLHEVKWGLTTESRIDAYALDRLPWITGVFESLRELRRADHPPSLVVIPYEEGGDTVASVLDALRIDRSLLAAGPSLRRGQRVGLKAHAVLRFMDECVTEMGVQVKRSELVHTFESRAFEFRDETHDFDVLGYETKLRLHEHALSSAQQFRVPEYLATFSGALLEPQAFQSSIDRTLISSQDLADLKRHLSNRHSNGAARNLDHPIRPGRHRDSHASHRGAERSARTMLPRHTVDSDRSPVQAERRRMVSDQGIYAQPREVTSLEECAFYHVMDLPGVGVVGNQWDLRGGEDAYLGGVDFEGKRVLEVGPASGYLTVHLESRGADVVAVELGAGEEWDIVPQHGLDAAGIRGTRTQAMELLRNSFWYTHRAFGSSARVHYGTAYELPAELGRFDVAALGSVLLHTRNPLLILERCAQLVDEALVIVDRDWPELRGAPICRLEPSVENESFDTWWAFSPDLFVQFASVLGFPDAEVTFHRQRHHGGPGSTTSALIDLFTVVARRR